MDPVTLAVLTAVAYEIGRECVKGVASEAGKDAWGKIKALFGWKEEPSAAELPTKIAQKLLADGEVAAQVKTLLAEIERSSGSPQMIGTLVGTLNAQKVAVVGQARDVRF